MPLEGTEREMFHEVRHGETYSKTRKRHGKKAANRQMVAIVLNKQRDKKRKGRTSSR